MNNKKKKRLGSVAYCLIAVAVVLLLLAFLIPIFGGGKSNDVEVSGGGKTTGLRCTDSDVLHPALRDYTPVSHTNTIMANFAENGELSTITLYYVGDYGSSMEAERAEAYAQADYGLILAKEYGVNVEAFSHSFSIDGSKVSLTITAKDGNVNDKTAPYFLLEQGRLFPKSLDELEKRYEERSFSCEITN